MLIETTQQMQVIFLHLETDLERIRPIASQTESTTWLKLKFSCVHEMFAADESCDQWNDEWSAAYGVSALTQALSSPDQARLPPPVFLPTPVFLPIRVFLPTPSILANLSIARHQFSWAQCTPTRIPLSFCFQMT